MVVPQFDPAHSPATRPVSPVVTVPAAVPDEHATERAIEDLHAALGGGGAQEIVDRAITVSREAHEGMVRRSGDPYVVHPISVAAILAKMQLDGETLAAAILHDVVEDTPVSLEMVETEFGPRVARLVDGVTKLGKIPWTGEGDHASREREHQAENLRKMFLAMVDDIGVVLIKLADRLHNMRTLDAMPRDKQLRIAQQTMEIYAPLANRLGIWQFKSELEDLAFRYLEPFEYHRITKLLDERGRDQKDTIERVMADLREALDAAGIAADLSGRQKHAYSIYRKMRQKNRRFDEIYDVIGIRIIVEDRAACYGALGVIHEKWHPIPGEFDDYIATPKDSMYQSLHTAVIGPGGQAVELQFRTREMHHVAEYGVAAHWRYKEGGGKAGAKVEAKIAWLRQLMDWRDEVADAEEFVESLKSDVFQEMLYVFTPAGDIIELPAGATPVDFAYRIHTEVGHHCVGAKVNDQQVALDHKLQNGQVVKIMTSKTKGPSRDWLQADAGYVTTASAREKIRQWYRRQQRDDNVALGRDILDRELRRLSLDAKNDDVLKHFPRYQKMDDLLAAIGYGAVSSQVIAARLGETRKEEFAATPYVPAPRTPARLEILGAGGLLSHLAPCCNPVSGDQIIGFTTRGRGVTVHRTDCPNIIHIAEPERLLPVSWSDQGGDTFAVSIHVSAWDRVGLLKDITTLLADAKVNILGVLTTTHDDRTVTLLLTLEVEGVKQLSTILNRLENVRDVLDVRRDVSGSKRT